MIEDREGDEDIAKLRAALRGDGAAFVRWTPEAAARVAGLAAVVAAFRPLPHPDLARLWLPLQTRDGAA